jgi:hypothetical protein
MSRDEREEWVKVLLAPVSRDVESAPHDAGSPCTGRTSLDSA